MRDYRSVPPVEIVGAQGVHLETADGRRLIDAISSWWCKSLGHGHPHLRRALIDQAERFEHVILANSTNAGLVRFCERILALANVAPPMVWAADSGPIPVAGPFTKVFFADNGSTGVEVALKMALQWQAQTGAPQRRHFAALGEGYHGETIGAMSVSDLGLYKAPFASLCSEVTMLGPLPRRSGPADPAWQDAAAEWLPIAAQLDAVGSDLAAVIIEPVLQGAAGMRLYSPDLLRRLRVWCDANGVLLIADEIAAGMGRLGAPLASHLAGIQADLVVLSKGLTGGFLPLSVTLCTERIAAAFDADYLDGKAFLHSNTYAGNALAVAVANAALDVYAETDLCAEVARRGPRLLAGLRDLAASRPWLRDLRGCGMVAAADLRQADGSPFPRERRLGWQVFQAGLRHGAWLRPLGDTVYLFPPLTITDAEMDALFVAFAASLDEVMG